MNKRRLTEKFLSFTIILICVSVADIPVSSQGYSICGISGRCGIYGGCGISSISGRCGISSISSISGGYGISGKNGAAASVYKCTDTEGIIRNGVSMDMVSGPTTVLPWKEDREFIKARLRNNTNVLLGGYRTVLKDPLPGEEYNVHLAASLLAGTVINPGEVFSQNQTIGPYSEEKGFEKGPTYIGTTLTTTIGGGVCKIASTLYNVAVLSNLKIVERHNHSMPVPYVPYGQDATVAFGVKDIRFKNDTESDIMIWAQGIDNVLYIAFYGSQPGPSVEWTHEVTQVREAPVKYTINPQLSAGEEKCLLEGMDGAVVKSWVTVSTGNSVNVKYMGVSDYQPMPHLVERGPIHRDTCN